MNQLEKQVKELSKKIDIIAEALNAYRVEEVAAVILRPHETEDGRTIPRIDFYPAWNATFTYGYHKIASEYLDHDWQINRFQYYSGLMVADLPEYEGQQALKRRADRVHPCEVTVPKPFALMIKPQPGDGDGPAGKTLILNYMEATARQEPRPAPHQAIHGQAERETAKPEPPRRPKQVTPTVTLPERDYATELITAADQLIFEEALWRVEPFFRNGTTAAQFRGVLFDEFQPKLAPAYAAAMLEYALHRKNKKDHNTAKARAYEKFRESLPESE